MVMTVMLYFPDSYSLSLLFFILLLLFFLAVLCEACRILVPRPGIELTPPAVEG